jgi:hypothetical protein
VKTPSATTGDADNVGGCGLIERCHRHRLRRSYRRKAEANSKRRRSKELHGLLLSSLSFAATRRFTLYVNNVAAR